MSVPNARIGAGGVLAPLAPLPRRRRQSPDDQPRGTRIADLPSGPTPPLAFGLPTPAVSALYQFANTSSYDDHLYDDGDGDGSDDEDDRVPWDGSKKRKVPIPLVPGSSADVDTGRDGADRNPARSMRESADPTSNVIRPNKLTPLHRLKRSPASHLALSRRVVFLRRKAALISLYLDAQAAIATSSAHLATRTSTSAVAPKRPTLPDVSTFERLLPALEDVETWPADAPGWRAGDDGGGVDVDGRGLEASVLPKRTLERWRTGFAKRKRARAERVPVVRGGWAPEGSFELDIPSQASIMARSRAKERAALTLLAQELRTLVLAAAKLPLTQSSTPIVSPPTSASLANVTPSVLGTLSDTPSTVAGSPSEQAAQASTKKKGKKKKRSTLANQGNPHHVDNYRPSRPVPVSDPYEPWPHHASLLFPPPMRVLAARKGGQDVRPGEEEYICWSCEYALFYGSEALRRQAIKQRKAELKRREKILSRAKDVAAGGRRARRLAEGGGDDETDDDDYDDEDDCDGHGRCTCGRALGNLHLDDEEDEPPDKDPPDPH